MKVLRFTVYNICLIILLQINILSETTYADNLNSQKEALGVILGFADRICDNKVPLEGSADKIELSGTAKLELNELIKNIVGIGIKGAAKYEESDYKGVLQQDLAGLLKNKTECYLKVVELLKGSFIPDNAGSQHGSPPTISNFESSQQQVYIGSKVILEWNVANSNSVEIKPEIGKVAARGKQILSPSSTSIYTLNAQNEWGTSTATQKIIVLPKKRLYVRAVVTPTGSVRSGEKATIYIEVMDDDGIVPDATVLVSAGGGKFLERATSDYSPTDNLHGPFSVSGHTASNGVFTTWWVCNPCATGYGMSVKASKEGYAEGSSDLMVDLQ